MLPILDRFAKARVAVIGDLILDCYLHGDVSRISPEAPVPVVRSLSEEVVAGGAANVVANLATLGVIVDVVGLTGLDNARDSLIDRLQTHGEIDISGMIGVADRPTTRKLRVLGAHQQIVRVDHEDTSPCGSRVEDQLLEAALSAVDRADVVILSDYGKGVLSQRILREVIAKCNAVGKKVLVDPKQLDLSAYSGASILTPNRKELTASTRLPCETDAEALVAAAAAQEMSGANVLLTRSEKGMSFFPLSGEPIHLATVAQDVFDVSGAGDTVIAVMAASLATGLSVRDSMKLANHAAGIVVAKVGTACVMPEELAASLAAELASPSVNDGRHISREEAVAQRWAWAREKLTVGVANGCFDLLHPGHVSLIKQAAAACDRLIMALNSDASVRRLKGPSRPIQDEESRAAVMGALKGVSAVVLFDEDTPLELIKALQPDILVKGADYTEDNVVGAEIVKARGGRIVLAQLSPGQSTSKLVATSKLLAKTETAY
ncbi:D-beta-D-heptose 7-phosphate kinase / D-beta-D-heptose 1-phosphate adenylyltransferase [Methylocella tundrae]|uniref:Bifunctional protein HldE n=1 Tax=Methylocella tundrae TaxID=227605 RepID=A0A8B6M977_METTU|nr:D-glycero-beta-D-manno-heptose-7-phosphate kinase [Methylocella tundrae]VTZ26550.1 D-beta-D-heptose 7-phosphate kinase / D-beta-D-heptose 1-phosphate adenylyltransferase [Methylocella tundrae]VTZ51470.1 D-beta-D-heptose 7-phosphate kinase / D-beta-D-heptose 1-phosphate adenylyltransferase [Methylocella tundrae]